MGYGEEDDQDGPPRIGQPLYDGCMFPMCPLFRSSTSTPVVLYLGPGRLCRHCFEHNRSLKALSIIGHYS